MTYIFSVSMRGDHPPRVCGRGEGAEGMSRKETIEIVISGCGEENIAVKACIRQNGGLPWG